MAAQITKEQLEKMGFNVYPIDKPVTMIAGLAMKARTFRFDSLDQFYMEFQDYIHCATPLFVRFDEGITSRHFDVENTFGHIEQGVYLRIFHHKSEHLND